MVNTADFYKHVKVEFNGLEETGPLGKRLSRLLDEVVQRLPDEEQFKLQGHIEFCTRETFIEKCEGLIHEFGNVGGLQMNIQELGTIRKNNLNIKLILLNNHGHGIIRTTQDTWLKGRYNASTPDSGLPDPNYKNIAEAYGIPSMVINNHRELNKLDDLVKSEGPVFCNVELLPDQKMIPKLKFGKPIEDSEPELSRDEFLENMIIRPLD